VHDRLRGVIVRQLSDGRVRDVEVVKKR